MHESAASSLGRGQPQNLEGKILVVDDNELNRDMLARRLQRKGYEVEVAVGGREAIVAISENDFDLVLLDIMMPDVDGLEVLETVRRRFDISELPIVMATAKTASDDIVKALKMGASDYVTKPIDFQVVLARVQTQIHLKIAIDRNRSLETSLALQNESLEKANRYMQQSLQSAAKFQQSLLTQIPPVTDGVEIAWRYSPCDELAGDSYGVYELGADKILIYQLDVAGHGVKAALLAVTLLHLLNPTTPGNLVLENATDGNPVSPQDVVAELNRRFQINEESNQFFTMVYGIYDCKSGVFRYVNAAHSTPIAISSGATLIDEESNVPVGVLPDIEFVENTLVLNKGDAIVVYSDGIIEASGPENELFGEDRLVEFLSSNGSGVVDDVVRQLELTVREWSGDIGLEDDLSILMVKRS